MKKSDLMGRFDFDGAEGIAFWIGDSDTEPIAKVMFDELETLKAFIEHNLPGMFGTDAVVTEEMIADTLCSYQRHTGDRECEYDHETARAILALFRGGAK